MSRKTLDLSEALSGYLQQVQPELSDIERRMLEETAQLPGAGMQIAPEQASLLSVLAASIGAVHTLEVGVFTGLSTLAVARALPAHGRVVAMDIDAATTERARAYWEAAGVADRIELHIAPALETLDGLLAAGKQDRFDFAFIDADKRNYWHYFERCLALLRPGGLIAVDNVLWHGKVADKNENDATTAAIRDFNARLREDTRVLHAVVPVGDGLTLAVKRPTSSTTRDAQ